MKGITIGLLVAAGVAGLWAAQRASAQRDDARLALSDQRSTQPAANARNIPNVTARPSNPSDESIDPKMVITPKADIDPKMVVNPPPPRSPADKSYLKPSDNH